MKRRNFIKLSATASVIGLTPLELSAALKPLNNFFECNDITNRKIVLINLNGGNDGLNSVIPLNQYSHYKNLRPTLAIPNSGANAYFHLDKSLPDNQQVGLHPGLKNFKSIYDNGMLRIIQSVGYPSLNKSHFKSTDLMLTGNDGNSLLNGEQSGWIGRFMEQYYTDHLDKTYPIAIEMGSQKSSLGFHGLFEHGLSLNITGQDPGGYYSILNGLGGTPPQNIPDSDYGKELDFIIKTDALSNKYAQTISSSFNSGQNLVSYPDTDISNQLKTVARLISGDLQSKVYMVSLGGFDTHGGQAEDAGEPKGRHNELLLQLSEGIEYFLNDLSQQNLAEDVVGLTFSEFGRKAKENGNLGTDHGEVAPMFVFGNAVEGGVSGTNPNLKEATDQNNFQIKTVQFDYRSTIGTLLKDFLGTPDTIIDSTFFNHSMNESFNNSNIDNLIKEKFNVTKSCVVSKPDGLKEGQQWHVYPNPVQDLLRFVSISEEEFLTFELYSSSGALLTSKTYKTDFGRHGLYLGHLSSGTYMLKIITNGKSEIHKILKL